MFLKKEQTANKLKHYTVLKWKITFSKFHPHIGFVFLWNKNTNKQRYEKFKMESSPPTEEKWFDFKQLGLSFRLPSLLQHLRLRNVLSVTSIFRLRRFTFSRAFQCFNRVEHSVLRLRKCLKWTSDILQIFLTTTSINFSFRPNCLHYQSSSKQEYFT